MAKIRTPKGTPTPTPRATLWLFFESAEFVGVGLELLLRGVLVLEGALELGVEVELLGVEDDDELSENALETVINEAAPDGELKTVIVDIGVITVFALAAGAFRPGTAPDVGIAIALSATVVDQSIVDISRA
ncbi:hypothetical protein OEA41_010336 [Lepraria neglecta]|uniref:Uncharacterized protein n=1 Tax=Lepraria neglecta TaxID=209136 RepID=A0AAD9YWD8_9LECA|nr:hypothetical protein OEA41_010336 [Lepraria neglecta]